MHGFTVYEEFVHPYETSESVPRLEGRWDKYVYPLLQIKNSAWMNSLPDFIFPNALHYRLVTLNHIVDMLCDKPPGIMWVDGSSLTAETPSGGVEMIR